MYIYAYRISERIPGRTRKMRPQFEVSIVTSVVRYIFRTNTHLGEFYISQYLIALFGENYFRLMQRVCFVIIKIELHSRYETGSCSSRMQNSSVPNKLLQGVIRKYLLFCSSRKKILVVYDLRILIYCIQIYCYFLLLQTILRF